MQTIDQNGNVINSGELQKAFKDAELALQVYRTALSLEIQAKMAVDANDPNKIIITLVDATPEQLGMLKRKTTIANWSKAATKMANTVTNAVTQVGDYALNGALAPTVVAGANMVFTTGRVAGTALTRAAAGTTASLLFNGRVAVKEIAKSREVDAVCHEFKQTVADAGKGLASLFGIDNDVAMDGWEDPAQVQATQTAQTQAQQTA